MVNIFAFVHNIYIEERAGAGGRVKTFSTSKSVGVVTRLCASFLPSLLPSKIHFAVNLSFQEDKRQTAISTA